MIEKHHYCKGINLIFHLILNMKNPEFDGTVKWSRILNPEIRTLTHSPILKVSYGRVYTIQAFPYELKNTFLKKSFR